MTFTIAFSWWAIPLIVTIAAFLWASFWRADESGMFGYFVRPLYMFVPAIIVSLLAWAVAGALK